MCKFCLQNGERMTSSGAYVDDAALMADRLTWALANGPGDYANAMERAAAAAKVPRGLLWRLRYRRPNLVDPAHFERLGAACGRYQVFTPPRESAQSFKTALARVLVHSADALDRLAGALDRGADGLDRLGGALDGAGDPRDRPEDRARRESPARQSQDARR